MSKWIHKLLKVDEEAKRGVCANCGEVGIYWQPGKSRWRCRVARKQHKGNQGPRGPKAIYARRRDIKSDLLAEQDGKCAICCTLLTDPKLDHCHSTDLVRGVLCHPCNVGLGWFKDNPAMLRMAAEYVERYAQDESPRPRYSTGT